MATTRLKEIADDNAFIATVGPNRGRSVSSGKVEVYHGTDVEGFIANAAASNTPIGGLLSTPTEIEDTGKYLVTFEGTDITTALAALADGTTVYLIVRSTEGNFRRYLPLKYRKTMAAG